MSILDLRCVGALLGRKVLWHVPPTTTACLPCIELGLQGGELAKSCMPPLWLGPSTSTHNSAHRPHHPPHIPPPLPHPPPHTPPRWDRHPCDITSYPELEQMVLDNKGRLASVKAGMNAGGGWGTPTQWVGVCVCVWGGVMWAGGGADDARKDS